MADAIIYTTVPIKLKKKYLFTRYFQYLGLGAKGSHTKVKGHYYSVNANLQQRPGKYLFESIFNRPNVAKTYHTVYKTGDNHPSSLL
jgi:hypothetical protein